MHNFLKEYLSRFYHSSIVLFLVTCFFTSQVAAQEERLLDTPDKWLQVGGDEKSFTFDDGQLSLNRGEHEPSDILTREDYENYELEFDCRLPDWCVSGLLLNVPRNGAHWAGLEIELNNNEHNPPQLTSAGAIFRKRVPNTLAMKPRGEWNHVYVKLDWPYLFVKINDQVVQDVDLNDNWVTRNTLRRGAIGFQNLGIPMQVKNFVVRRLPDTEESITLFNGKDLTGWKVLKGDAKWSVRDGAIVSEGYGYLHHEWIGQDFDLRLMVRTTPISNGGVFFRWKPGSLDDRGHEIQILDVPDAVVPTGSIYHFSRTNDLALTPGEWELMQIYVRENKVWTLVNGVNCAETEELPTIRPGYIVLQMHKDNAEVEFKDIVLVPYVEPEDDE